MTNTCTIKTERSEKEYSSFMTGPLKRDENGRLDLQYLELSLNAHLREKIIVEIVRKEEDVFIYRMYK